MTTLETERLLIRNFKSSDWEALHTMIIQYEYRFMPSMTRLADNAG
jgi:hypothetical protein